MRIQNFIETINGQELVLIGLTLGCFICNTHTVLILLIYILSKDCIYLLGKM